ncbi:MAG: glycosyltransferase family 4 protein, partial [candidate division Zixibacteria bacterium]
MRLLVVSTSFPKKAGDSLSPFMWDYCRFLKNLGWDITVLVPHHKGLKIEETWDGVRILRFQYLPESLEDLAYSGGLLPGLKSSPWKGLKIPFFIRSMYKETLNIISRENINIVNFHWFFPVSFWLGALLRKTNIPVVLTGHGTDVHLAKKNPFRYFANKALSKSSAVTVNSEYMRSILADLETPERVEVIPMGVDTEKFRSTGPGLINLKKILYIGRLIEQKGVGLLLDAFRTVIESVPEAVLEIVGYGPEKTRLREK